MENALLIPQGRRLAILEGRNKPKGNVRRRRELEAGPIQALASLAALIPGHFAALLIILTPAPPPFSSTDQVIGIAHG
jgi:hypothetical protein